MNTFYLKSKKIILENEIISGVIKVKDGIIDEIIQGDVNIPSDQLIDYQGKIIAPGYFDTHVHGYGGFDIMDCSEEAVKEISRQIVQNGVTSFLPTTLTDSYAKLTKACTIVNKVKAQCTGAKIQGIFLEGPFFTEKHKGAQNPAYMGSPDLDKLLHWQKASGNLVNKIAIAPEFSNTSDFIKGAKRNGIYVALGHSDATYEEATKAVLHGANIFVHIFNGMSPLHHRSPGMVGAALTTDAFCEIICDGHHVHKGAIKLVTKTKGKERTILVTDCMRAGGMPEGNYTLGDFDVVVKNGTARLNSGSLAGSILTLHQSVKNLVEWEIVSLLEAVNMASITPAKSVGLEDKIGSIAIGKYADFNILDNDLSISAVYIDGVKKYDKENS